MTDAPPRIVVFAFDLEEASQIRFIRSLRDCGAEVSSVSFRRGLMHKDFVPDWPDVGLGRGASGVGLSRLVALFRALPGLRRAAASLQRADLVIARNLDMALLALIARVVSGRRVPVVYQCLDIHSLMTGRGLKSRLARWLERCVLSRCATVIVSAPQFLDAYFAPIQRYFGASMLMENKLVFNDVPPAPRPAAPQVRRWGPVRIGWIGTLRCPRSFALLCSLARRAPGEVEIILRGVVHSHQLPDFLEQVAALPNMHYEGPYAYPQDLEGIYAGVDAVWGQDLWQRGGNSDWLLPNRLYEAGYFGCPLIAVRGSATAERLDNTGTGITIDGATPEAFARAILGSAARNRLIAMSGRLLARPADEFRDDRGDVRAVLAHASAPSAQGKLPVPLRNSGQVAAEPPATSVPS